MIRWLKFGALAGILLALTSSAVFAQNHFGHVRLLSPPRTISAHPEFSVTTPPRPIIVHLPGTPAFHRVLKGTKQPAALSSARQTEQDDIVPNVLAFVPNASFADTASLGSLQVLNNVPGLGFDYPHLAALNQDLGVRAIIDPVTQHELAITEQLLRSEPPTGASAFFPFYEGYSEPVAYQQQPPQIIVLQQPAEQVQRAEQTAPIPAPSPAEQPPLPPVGQFVLVLHSGKQIKAVAFTRQDDSIVYITSDGTRGVFPVSELDVTATQQLNQQHGTPLKLSL